MQNKNRTCAISIAMAALSMLGCASNGDGSMGGSTSVVGPAAVASGGLAGHGAATGAPAQGVGMPASTAGAMGTAGAAVGGGLPAGAAGTSGGLPAATGKAGGAAGAPASGSSGASGGAPPVVGGTEPTMLPMPMGDCPNIATGPLSVMGATVTLWVGAKSESQKGPFFVYWHGTGGSAATANLELDPTLVSEVMAQGGVILSMESGGKGNPIDWGVFTTGDYDIVDQVLACSIKQLNIDTRRIYTGGASAGGLAAGTMAYARSGYLAGSNPNSGGVAPWPGLATLQDPSHQPSILTMHGAAGVDVVVIDFGQASKDLDNDIVAKGGFAVDCDHGGGHVGAPADLKAAGWEFLKAHPFGTKPSPYAAGLPAGFPSYCKIVGK